MIILEYGWIIYREEARPIPIVSLRLHLKVWIEGQHLKLIAGLRTEDFPSERKWPKCAWSRRAALRHWLFCNGNKRGDVCSTSIANLQSVLSLGRYSQFPQTLVKKLSRAEKKFISQIRITYVGLSWSKLAHRLFCRLIRSFGIRAPFSGQIINWRSQRDVAVAYVATACITCVCVCVCAR